MGETPEKRPLEAAIEDDGAESDAPVTETRELMCVRLGTDHYAFPIERVLEVAKPETPTPVPRVPDWIPGVVRRGRGIVAVLDLAQLCGHNSEPQPARLTVVAEGELEAAIPVRGSRNRVSGAEVFIVRDAAWLVGIDATLVHGVRHQSTGMPLSPMLRALGLPFWMRGYSFTGEHELFFLVDLTSAIAKGAS